MEDCITSTFNSTKAVMVLVSFLLKMVTRDYPLYLKPYDYSKERVMSKVLCSRVELLLYTVDLCVFSHYYSVVHDKAYTLLCHASLFSFFQHITQPSNESIYSISLANACCLVIADLGLLIAFRKAFTNNKDKQFVKMETNRVH